MSRRLSRISLAFVLLLSSEVWALGLGDIKLESALGEPLRAEIELLSATPAELDALSIDLASADTFARYGLDRPYYLQEIEFEVVRSGREDGNAVRVRTRAPMAEPFLTFLVEANWSSGRLLREYTVLLDPPTYAPPVGKAAPAVQAPSRTRPSDAGQIERRPPMPQPAPEPVPEPVPEPEPRVEAPAAEPTPVVREPEARRSGELPHASGLTVA
jgi:pilus assembly protein FimV